MLRKRFGAKRQGLKDQRGRGRIAEPSASRLRNFVRANAAEAVWSEATEIEAIFLFRLAGSKAKRPPNELKNRLKVFTPQRLHFSYFLQHFPPLSVIRCSNHQHYTQARHRPRPSLSYRGPVAGIRAPGPGYLSFFH